MAIFSPIIRPVAAVAFDLDDTLFDRRATWRSLLEGWLGGGDAAQAEPEVMAADSHGHTPRREFFQWLWARFPGLAEDPTGLQTRFRRDFPRHVACDPVTAAALTELRSRGMELALLSNGNESFQTAKLRACGAAPFFQKSHMLFSGTLGFAKPDPRTFHALAHSLSQPPSAILFVGDDPLRDIAGARNAGMQTCRVRRSGRTPEGADADLVIDSLSELTGLLRIHA